MLRKARTFIELNNGFSVQKIAFGEENFLKSNHSGILAELRNLKLLQHWELTKCGCDEIKK